MFLKKNKLDYNLKYYLSENVYKSYRVLIKYKNFEASLEKKIHSYKGTVYNNIKTCNIISARLTAKGIDRILEYPEIEKIYMDEYLFLSGMSVSTANKCSYVLKSSLTGSGIGIGLVDSGVYPHKDLCTPSNRIVFFKDLINGLKYPYDDNGHGTAVSGILSSSGISSNNLYKGICPKAKLFCFKAFDKLGKGFASDILYAVEQLIDMSKEHNIKILCLPFELLSHNVFITGLFKTMFDYAVLNNIIPIVPAGSSFNNECSLIGLSTIQNCITVGGLDSTKSVLKPYEYSACGPIPGQNKPDLCAACVNIVSLNTDKNYISEKEGAKLYAKSLDVTHKTFSGSSIAAAYIAGICALILEKKPELGFKDVRSLLQISCESLDDIPKYMQGDGVVNFKKITE